MYLFKKILKNILILIIITNFIMIGILYHHNFIEQLNLEILILLLKNNINIFHFHYQCHEFCSGYINEADLEILLNELRGIITYD